jgi:DNA-binding transcriptional MerR regulator
MENNMISRSSGTNTTLATSDVPQSASPSSPGSLRRSTESYTVQQAAALTGLSEHNLRYYERIGLIEPVQRQESSGHRRYGPDDLAKLESIACLRATGMPIDQMRRYFELRSEGAYHADAVELEALLSKHLQELHRRMVALQTHIRYVELKVDYWRAVEVHDEQAAASIARQAQELIRAARIGHEAAGNEEV